MAVDATQKAKNDSTNVLSVKSSMGARSPPSCLAETYYLSPYQKPNPFNFELDTE
jgi:hypothetical protein